MNASITLLKSRPTWQGIRWSRGPLIRKIDSLDQIVRAMSGVTTAAASVARIVIEEPIEGTAFLNLITSLPADFAGDVLFISAFDRAFLSRVADDGSRQLYLIEGRAIERYADAHGLRDGATVPAAGGGGPAGGPPLERLRILIAEDEQKTREFLVSVLEPIGCETMIAVAGFEAVKMAQQSRPHVLLLDGLLPEMHGFEIARFVRGIDGAYRPRIVLVTAVYKHNRYQSEARLKYGVDQYLVKPVTRDQIANVIFMDVQP